MKKPTIEFMRTKFFFWRTGSFYLGFVSEDEPKTKNKTLAYTDPTGFPRGRRTRLTYKAISRYARF